MFFTQAFRLFNWAEFVKMLSMQKSDNMCNFKQVQHELY